MCCFVEVVRVIRERQPCGLLPDEYHRSNNTLAFHQIYNRLLSVVVYGMKRQRNDRNNIN